MKFHCRLEDIRLKAHSHQSTFKSEWYKGTDNNDSYTWATAFTIDVSDPSSLQVGNDGSYLLENVDIILGAAPSGTISGLLKDSSDENAKIGWAEITLHDPDDEDVTYWPGRLDREWIHDESTGEGYQSNNYLMVAPAGSYKIKIQFNDGSYLTSYYKNNGNGTFGTTSFEDADIVQINTSHTSDSPLANINFDVSGAPTGTIKGVFAEDGGTFSGEWYSVILRGPPKNGENGDILI